MRLYLLFLGLTLLCAASAQDDQKNELEDTAMGFLETLKQKGLELIKVAGERAKNVLKTALVELLGKVKDGDIKIPNEKRAIQLPSKEELMAKLGNLYDTVKDKIDDRVEQAKDLYEKGIEELKTAFQKVKNSDELEMLKEKADELLGKLKNTLREKNLITREVHEDFRRDITADLQEHMEYRVARNVGDKIANFFKKTFEDVKQHFSGLSEKAKKQWSEFQKTMKPYLERMKGEGKEALLKMKKEMINILNQMLSEMAGTMIDAVQGNTVAIDAVKQQIDQLEKET